MKYKIYYKGALLIEYDTLAECINCVNRMIDILNGGVSKEEFKIYSCNEDLMELVD